MPGLIKRSGLFVIFNPTFSRLIISEYESFLAGDKVCWGFDILWLKRELIASIIIFIFNALLFWFSESRSISLFIPIISTLNDDDIESIAEPGRG